MRILFLALDCPWPANNGLRLRTGSVLRALAEGGHDIAFLGFSTEPAAVVPAELRALCPGARLLPSPAPSLSGGWRRGLRAGFAGAPYSAARFASADARAHILAALEIGRIDAVMADTVYAAINLPSLLPVPLFINAHNIVFLILRRFAARMALRDPRAIAAAWEWRRLRAWEQAMWRRADLIVTCSEPDRVRVARAAPAALTAVVPNAMAAEPLIGAEERAHTVLYCGGMDWYPNRDAVLFFSRRILPRIRRRVPGVRLLVAGRRGPARFERQLASIAGLERHADVPDIRPLVAGACVSVVPLRIGSGTRLKIIEAAALGKPIVATPLGAEGLEFRHQFDILISDRPEDFAENVAILLLCPGLRAALGRAARATFERCYTQAAAARAVQRAVEQAMNSCPGRHRAYVA